MSRPAETQAPAPQSGPAPMPANALVLKVLAQELDQRRAEIIAIDPRLSIDIERLIAFATTGGKLLRPQFLCWGYLAAVGTPAAEANQLPTAVLRAAASLELIQACALLHDDIIDRSDTRRGEPTIHRSVAKAHAGEGWSGDPEHYGSSVAVLLGDLALAWADDLFTDAAIELDALAAALPAWRGMRTEVLAGQLLDLRVTADQAADPVTAEADAMRVNLFKTAAYTVGRPLHLGAALAGAPHHTIAALRDYGSAIGVAFQLRDDLLGVYGDPSVTGKPRGGDLVEGKRTVLLAKARQVLARSADAASALDELDSSLGTEMNAHQLDRLTGLIADTGAPADVEKMIVDLTEHGVAALGRTAAPGGAAVINPIVALELTRLAQEATMRRR